jgi:hypothetical protein
MIRNLTWIGIAVLLAVPLCKGQAERRATVSLDLTPVPAPMWSSRMVPASFSLIDSRQEPPTAKPTTVLSEDFFYGLEAHPRPNLEARAKLSIETFRTKRKQYVRIRLKNGKVITGPVEWARDDDFTLGTGLFAEESIKYADMASEPEPVAAAGQKFVRGLQITGMVVVVIVIAPLVLPILAIACATGTCVD